MFPLESPDGATDVTNLKNWSHLESPVLAGSSGTPNVNVRRR